MRKKRVGQVFLTVASFGVLASRKFWITLLVTLGAFAALYASLWAPVSAQSEVMCSTVGSGYYAVSTCTTIGSGGYQTYYGQVVCPPGSVPTDQGYCVVTEVYTLTLNTTITQTFTSSLTLVQTQTRHTNVTSSSTSTQVIGAGPVVCWGCNYGGMPFWLWPVAGGLLVGIGVGASLGAVGIRPIRRSALGPEKPSRQGVLNVQASSPLTSTAIPSATIASLLQALRELQNNLQTLSGPLPAEAEQYGAAASAAATLQNDLDSDNEISEMTSMQLQMLMDTRSKLLQTVSAIQKAMSDIEGAIAGNVKQ